MKILLINSVCGVRSTGRICTDIADEYSEKGYEVKIAYGRETVPQKYEKYAVRIGNDTDVKLHALISRLFDCSGRCSKNATAKFLSWVETFSPDEIWLHNLHGYYINYEMLFGWIKKHPNIKVKWTLHDCWAFTGHCTYFSALGCEKWKSGCGRCAQKGEYPASILKDACAENYEKKKRAFCGVGDMTLITPSQWLADLAKKSFLGEYPVEVRYNTIDKTVFKPTESNFRTKYGLENKKIILGVASEWVKRKGLDDFIGLSGKISDNMKIVLVGVTKKQIEALPDNIIGITRTESKRELAQIYTAADLFVNPSKEEAFGLTTLEAISCGTNVVVYKNTVCEEVVGLYGGIAVEQNPEALYDTVTNCLSGISNENNGRIKA